MEASYLERHPRMKDLLSLVIFIVCVLLGTLFINSFVFRSFSVVGPSMEPTLDTGDRLIVDRLPVTINQLQNKEYSPERGQIIVFENPQWPGYGPDEYIVKRVIAFGGERVVLQDGVLKVYNDEHKDGFEPDKLDENGHPGSPTTGKVDEVVPDGTLFVAGDHRQGSYSFDSRNGLGMIPLVNVVGPVFIQVYPLTEIRFL